MALAPEAPGGSGGGGGEVPALEGLTGSDANEGGEEALVPQQDPCSALDGPGRQGKAQGFRWKAPVNSLEISQMDSQLTSDWRGITSDGSRMAAWVKALRYPLRDSLCLCLSLCLKRLAKGKVSYRVHPHCDLCHTLWPSFPEGGGRGRSFFVITRFQKRSKKKKK